MRDNNRSFNFKTKCFGFREKQNKFARAERRTKDMINILLDK